jgi:hypothetical protein
LFIFCVDDRNDMFPSSNDHIRVARNGLSRKRVREFAIFLSRDGEVRTASGGFERLCDKPFKQDIHIKQRAFELNAARLF